MLLLIALEKIVVNLIQEPINRLLSYTDFAVPQPEIRRYFILLLLLFFFFASLAQEGKK